MKQLIGSIALVVLALQGLACSGADVASDSAETDSLETLRAADAAPHASSANAEAPARVELLSPAERDSQLAALDVTTPGDRESELEAVVDALDLADVLSHAVQLTARRELASEKRELSY